MAGTGFHEMPYSQIQIWRKNSPQDSVHHKVESISVNTAGNGGVCVSGRIVGNTYWCILFDTAQTVVQPGDILGLELQGHSNTKNEIFFTKGGPENYVFQQLGTSINISNNDDNSTSYTHTQQIPQIILNFTSGIASYFLSLSLPLLSPSLSLPPSLPLPLLSPSLSLPPSLSLFSLPLSPSLPLPLFLSLAHLCAFMINSLTL